MILAKKFLNQRSKVKRKLKRGEQRKHECCVLQTRIRKGRIIKIETV